VLAVDKPGGMTSHDVVAAVRRATGERRIGHAGTLDPLATGLLVVLVGPYTRLEPYLSASAKTYEARIAFGSETDTDDAEGTVTTSLPVSPDLFDPARAQEVLDRLIGPSMQAPPAYSAIKVAGRAAHRVARAGGHVSLAERPIDVFEARLTGADAGERVWDVTFRVSKGTYVRALARDIGRSCGTAAHLGALRRTASGALELTHAHSLDEVAAAAHDGTLGELFADALAAVALPVVDADPAEVVTGRTLPRAMAPQLPPGARAAAAVQGRLLGVYRVSAEGLKPEAVFAGACR
jgi:tRNA pseudouridine55 synthase